MQPDKLLDWSPWHPLLGCWRGLTIPALPGLYRIRRAGRDFLDYIGQTGTGTMTLRKRLGMLAGIFGDVMPYNDPHTAGPALWGLRLQGGESFEVSVSPVEGLAPWRKGLEALAISLHRQEHRRSPTANFGRMPTGYHKSSGNTQTLVLAGKRYRGGQTAEADFRHLPGIEPAGPLGGAPQGPTWCGHQWTAWRLVQEVLNLPPAGAAGLYRIRDGASPDLLYIGEGLIDARLLAHLKKVAGPGNRQGAIFGSAQQLECSWVLNETWHHHQRLELENDLIAAHLLATGAVPAAQFLG